MDERKDMCGSVIVGDNILVYMCMVGVCISVITAMSDIMLVGNDDK